MTTMPSGVIKGRLTAQLNLGNTTPFTVSMSAGTTGTAIATGDYVVIIVDAAGSTTTANTPVVPTGFRELIPWQALGTSTSTCYGVYIRKRVSTDTDYTITQSNVGRANAVHARVFWIDGAGAKGVDDWALGTIQTRAASGGTFNTIAPSVTTTIDNSMVWAFGLERTTATETDTQLTVAGTGWTKQLAYLGPAVSDTTVTIASKGMATAGATGDATFTAPNTQATNGAAFQLVVPPADTAPPTSVAGTMYDGSNVVNGHWYVKNSVASSGPTGVDACSWAGMVWPGYSSITEMLSKDPFYCGHRGGSVNWPEMSLQGYTQAALRGYGALEVSLARTSDGVWFGLHDASLDRTSLGTGGGSGTTYVASSMTWAQVQTHDILPATGSPVDTTHRPYATLDEILSAYLKSHVIFIDPKAALAYRNELISILKTYPDWQDKIVAKYVPGNSNVSWLSAARTAGFVTNAMFYASDTFATYQAQADILGMEYGASSTVWTQIKSYGKPVIGHVCPSQASVNTAIANGADGLMVSGPNQVRLVTLP